MRSMTVSNTSAEKTDLPVNTPLSRFEFIARNIYKTSQYDKKLKKDRFYPRYRKESKYFTGSHVCRLSVQRLCLAGWEKAIFWANQTKSGNQNLVGFEIAPCQAALDSGFSLEPAASERNPFHAHIYIKELDLPYPQPEEVIDGIMGSIVKHRIDNMAREFGFYTLEKIPTGTEIHGSADCAYCLKR